MLRTGQADGCWMGGKTCPVGAIDLVGEPMKVPHRLMSNGPPGFFREMSAQASVDALKVATGES